MSIALPDHVQERERQQREGEETDERDEARQNRVDEVRGGHWATRLRAFHLRD